MPQQHAPTKRALVQKQIRLSRQCTLATPGADILEGREGTASQSIRLLRRGRLTLVDDEDRLGMRAGVDVRIPHRHDVEQALVFHNCHVPPGSRCLAVGMLPGALLIIELSDLHYASFAPLLRAPRISRRSR